jgi:hypothetical protein
MVAAGDRMLALDERGELLLFRANPEKFELLDRKKMLTSRLGPIWLSMTTRSYSRTESSLGIPLAINVTGRGLVHLSGKKNSMRRTVDGRVHGPDLLEPRPAGSERSVRRHVSPTASFAYRNT